MARRPQLEGPSSSEPIPEELPDQLPDVDLEADETLWALFGYRQRAANVSLESLDLPATKTQMDDFLSRMDVIQHRGQWSQDYFWSPRSESSLWNLIHSAWLGLSPPVKIWLGGSIELSDYMSYGVDGYLDVKFGNIEYQIEVYGEELSAVANEAAGDPTDSESRYLSFVLDELKWRLPLDSNDEFVVLVSEFHDVEFSDSFAEVMVSLSRAFAEAAAAGAKQISNIKDIVRTAVKEADRLEAEATEAEREEQAWYDEYEDDE